MKSLFNIISIFFSLGILNIYGQTNMTNYHLANPSTNVLSVSAVFDANNTNVGLSNATINFFVPIGYSAPVLTNSWSQATFIPEANLVAFCGASASGFNFYSFSRSGIQELGNVISGQNVFLTQITFTGTSSVPLEGLNFPPPFPHHSCLIGVGSNNTASIRWGTGQPFIGEENFPMTPQNILLPIYLHSFSADKHSDRSTKLSWNTSSEINSSHFEIERSHDGAAWEYIGEVVAAGNSTNTRSYDFIDDRLPLNRSKNQIFYYRLRMVDQDGAFKYSDIRGVNFTINDRGVVSIYPNPASQYFNIDLTGIDFSTEEKATVYIYDMSGRLVRQKDIIGSGLEPFSVYELPAETYNVIIRHGDDQYSKKVIVTK